MKAQAASAPTAAGAVTISGWRLNVRQNPGTNSPIVGHLYKGSYISLLSRAGDWWQVEYADGQYGWCHADYITPVQGSPARVNTTWGSLNVRRGPGSSYSAISLSVPDFMQTDSRWAHVTIGSSGKTMAKIGCATTAIAMMESCRTGTTIYPDTMSRQLSYTPSGSVYWPNHYTVVTDNSLDAIYRLLTQGKPVLYGAKNQYGGQHWVVIKGFTGGNKLTTENFTIEDPGSGSRSTLAQFLSAYPTFYKYFHY